MFCENCGTNVPDGIKFCPECGAEIKPANAPVQSQGNYGQTSGNAQAGSGGKPAWLRNRRKLYYGLGIAAAVVILVIGGIAVSSFSTDDHRPGEQGQVMNPDAPKLSKSDLIAKGKAQRKAQRKSGEGITKDAGQQAPAAAPDASADRPAADDPIRANIAAGKSSTASSLGWFYLDRYLQMLAGDWYDEKGNKLVTVNNRYINGCEVTSAYDFSGGGGQAGTFRFAENGQEWDVRLSWHITNSADDSLTVNGKQILHRANK